MLKKIITYIYNILISQFIIVLLSVNYFILRLIYKD